MQKDQVISLKIHDLAYGGKAVSRISDGGRDFVVFVEGAVPGDEGEVKIVKIKKNFAEGKMVRLTEDSPFRIKARCEHFGTCGGCHWQFLKYEDQLRFKEKIVKDSIERIGGIKIPENIFQPILGCENPWFYRNKMEYSFGENSKGLVLGLHLPGSFSQIFDLEECFLQSEKSVTIALAVKKWAREKNLTAYDPRKKSGLLRSLFVREGKNTGDLMVNLEISHEPFSEKKSLKKLFEENFPEITSLFLTRQIIQKGSRTKIEQECLAGKNTLSEILSFPYEKKLLSLHFDIAPQAFFQPNTHQAEVLYRHILEFAEPQETDTVYDLFCGTGTIGMFFAKVVKKVFGIEMNRDAVQNARFNSGRNHIKNIEFLEGDVCKVIFNLKEKPNIVVADPPRAGIFPKTLEKILQFSPPKMIYVSCNPATLGRDLKIISQKYSIEKIQPIDLFPQTYHIETVVLLKHK